MPQQGEIRRGATESVQWDGSRWQPLQPSDTAPAMHHPGLSESPVDAELGELGRTAKEAGIGLLRSPLDMAEGLYNTVRHPLDTLVGMGKAVAHPVDTVKAIGDDPRMGGSLLGQLLLAPKLPGMAETAAAEGPGVVGRGVGAVGRGMEAVGTSAPAKAAGGFGAMEAALRLDPKGLAIAAAPKALELGGRGLQSVGRSIEGLKLGMGDEPIASPVTRASWEAKKAQDFPYQREGMPSMGNEPDQDPSELFPYQKDSLGKQESESLVDPRDQPMMSPSMRGLSDAMSPRDEIVKRYLSDDPTSAFARLRAAQGGR